MEFDPEKAEWLIPPALGNGPKEPISTRHRVRQIEGTA
jgi:hypothetical protein